MLFPQSRFDPLLLFLQLFRSGGVPLPLPGDLLLQRLELRLFSGGFALERGGFPQRFPERVRTRCAS